MLLLFLRNWNVNECSPLCDLTTKLATLLTCLSIQRVHTISLIDSRNIKFDNSATFIYIFEDLKVQRKRPCFTITLPSLYEEDPLETSKLLQLYLDKTHFFRKCNDEKGLKDRLFLACTPPHQPVTTDTIARCIRGVLQKAGIDTKLFGAHSVRGAAASSARNANAPLDAVLSAGDWSSAKTFNRHYFRLNSFKDNSRVSRILAFGVKDFE